MEKRLSTKEALQVANDYGCSVSRVTMINWARKGIGIKVGGRWYINKELLVKVLEGKR